MGKALKDLVESNINPLKELEFKSLFVLYLAKASPILQYLSLNLPPPNVKESSIPLLTLLDDDHRKVLSNKGKLV